MAKVIILNQKKKDIEDKQTGQKTPFVVLEALQYDADKDEHFIERFYVKPEQAIDPKLVSKLFDPKTDGFGVLDADMSLKRAFNGTYKPKISNIRPE